MIERIADTEKHDSMRGWFSHDLHNAMVDNDKIILLTGDLGFGQFDKIRDHFPDRFLNCGASEQAMMGIAVGMTYEGKIPFVYSITNFALYRPYEWIRNYVNHEMAPVKIIAGGRDLDYHEDGFSHHSEDAREVLKTLPNIKQYFPETKDEVLGLAAEVANNNQPSFVSLRRKW